MHLKFRRTSTMLVAVAALSVSIGSAHAQRNVDEHQVATVKYLTPDLQVLPNIPQPCTLMFHGLTRESDQFAGSHRLTVNIYNALGTLLKTDAVSAPIEHGAYTVTLTNMPPAIRMRTEQITVGVAIDNTPEALWPVTIQHAREFSSDVYVASVDATRLEKTIAEANDRLDRDSEAAHNNSLAVREIDPMSGNVKIKTLAEYAGQDYRNPPTVKIELGVAGPQGLALNTQTAMDYGHGTVELRNLVTVFGSKLGLGAQMMRSGNNFRYQAAGIVADVNNDGAVIATIGVAKYQTGSDLTQPYTISPFSRIQYFSSPKGVFFYSEIEATVHLHGFLSGTAGLGVAFLGVEVVAGYHYSMYSVTTEMNMQSVNGFSSMVNFAF
jgi:hypothetical protein